tara:strand:+ start:1290 stop:1760 length:471 start_codon:yes stop_codon:yes gene_type:complete
MNTNDINKHADGWESDEIFRSMRRNCEAYKKKDMELTKIKQEKDALQEKLDKMNKENEALKKEINGLRTLYIGDDASNKISSLLESSEFNNLALTTQKMYEKNIRCIMSGEGDNACGVKHGMTLPDALICVKASPKNDKLHGSPHAALKKFIKFLE